MVHIDELFKAFQDFQAAAVEASRDPASYNKTLQPAREAFMKFCSDNNLPIDFTERS